MSGQEQLQQAKDAVVDYVSKYNGTTSFAEIERELEERKLVVHSPNPSEDNVSVIHWSFLPQYRDRISNVVAWLQKTTCSPTR